MARSTPEEKKARLREQLAKIERELQQADAQVRVAQKQQEIRRQILAGRVAIRHMETYPEDAWSKRLTQMLSKTIQGKDRALFPLLESAGVTNVASSEMVHSPSDR